MRPRSLVGALLAGALLVSGAYAQDFEEPTIVQSIVLRGTLPGPAWWRVSDADSIVHILVIPDSAPARMAWDASVLEARLDRARLLIMPVEVHVGVTQLPGLIRTLTGEVMDKQDLETTLPEPLRGRFIAARTAAGMKREQVSGLSPVYAAERLERQVRKNQKVATGEVVNTVQAAARKHAVRLTRPTVKFMPDRVKLSPMAAAAGLSRERECMAATLRTMNPIIDAQRQAALDWAAGDVRGLLSLPRLSYRAPCDNDILSRLDRTHRPELLRAQIDAVEAALKTPGESIAIVSPGLLLSDDGVLMTLKARGHDIRTPANISDR